MLLRSGAVPSGDAWALELKWDGCRRSSATTAARSRCARATAASARRTSRARGDRGALGKRRVTLDGELVCLRSMAGPTSPGSVTGSPARRSRHPAMLQVFDLLHSTALDARAPVCGAPRAARGARARRARLANARERGGRAGRGLRRRVEELGLEGVVAKRLSSTYLPGRRCTAWVKHKLRREERLAVTGVRRTRRASRRSSSPAARPTARSPARARSSSAYAASSSSSSSAASPSCRPAAAARSPGIRPRSRCSLASRSARRAGARRDPARSVASERTPEVRGLGVGFAHGTTPLLHVPALPGRPDLEQHQRDRLGNPRRVVRRARNVTVGRTLGRGGFWRWL